MANPIKSTCSMRFYPAYHRDGTRSPSAIELVVIHSAEATSAKGVARYFQGSTAGGSTHLVIDDEECYRCLSDGTIPRGARGANTNGFHIEQCGYAAWSRAEWKSHDRMLRRVAYKTAYHCRKFRIPVRFVDAAGLKRGLEGITTHVEVTRAFSGGSGHWDPGPGWPRALFMGYVEQYRKELK